MDVITTQIDFFQKGGADETRAAATREWLSSGPGRGRRVVEASFVSASPGGRDGRWVTIQIKHTMDRSYSFAD